MLYRKFGRTNLSVSTLGFGGSSLGGVFGPVDESTSIRTVNTALDCGINLFDTAPFYGATRAETALGRALRTIPRERFFVSTKVGRYGPTQAEFDFSADRTLRSIDESLARLGLDHVDLLQAHDIEFGETRQIIEETLPALEKIKASGKARFIGISGLHLHLLARVVEQAPLDFVQTYCHGTLVDSTLQDWLPRFERAGLGVFNSAPLAMRLLSDQGPPDWHPAPPRVRQACAEAAAYCRAHQVDFSEIALRYSLTLPGVHCTILGASSPDEVLRNVRACEAPSPSAEMLRPLLEILKPALGVSWPSGRPENQP
ncbi:MAG TPA: aldo/keto reductase [Opitutaceae bacterium]|nr:aldo/keto reductase [Opitutaceae bacterium]